MTTLTWEVVTIHLRHPFILSDSEITYRRTVILSLESDGVKGLGESAPSSYFGETVESVAGVLSRARRSVEACGNLSDLETYLTSEFPSHPSARSGLIMAYLDLESKRRQLPLRTFLNLPEPHATTSFTIGIDKPEIVKKKIGEAADFPILKIKLGRGDEDYEILRTVRQSTSKTLRVDVNEGWSFEEAQRKIEWLSPQNVELIEQPLDKMDIDGHGRLPRSLPIFGDESICSFDDLRTRGRAFDGINVKLDKCGGLLEAVRMAREARSMGLRTMLGCMVQTSVGISAAAHLSGLFDYVDLDGHLLIRDDPYTGLPIQNGRYCLTSIPGLGIHPTKV